MDVLEDLQADLYLSVENSCILNEFARGVYKGLHPRKCRIVKFREKEYFIKFYCINLLEAALSEFKMLKAMQHPLVVKCYGFYCDDVWARLYLEHLSPDWGNLTKMPRLSADDKSVIMSQVRELREFMLKKRIIIVPNRPGFKEGEIWHEDFINIRLDLEFCDDDKELGIRRYNGNRIKFEFDPINVMYNPVLKQIKLIDLTEGEIGWTGASERFEEFVKGLAV